MPTLAVLYGTNALFENAGPGGYEALLDCRQKVAEIFVNAVCPSETGKAPSDVKLVGYYTFDGHFMDSSPFKITALALGMYSLLTALRGKPFMSMAIMAAFLYQAVLL